MKLPLYTALCAAALTLAARCGGRNWIGAAALNGLAPGGRAPPAPNPSPHPADRPRPPQKAGVSLFVTVSAMRDEQREVSVSFDPRRGYFTVGSELFQNVTALSLGGLRRRIEATLLPDEPVIQLRLDRAARHERDRRRAQL
jgi:hypothetical protein